MAKEQEEAIETVEGMVKSYIEADECGLSNNDFKNQIRAMQTVLNMLKEKDKQINSKNGAINALQCALKERTEERDRKDNIVTKQNKIIDLTINFIYEIWCKYPGSISYELRLNGFNDDECDTCENTNRNCIECLKQYFEKLAKEKGE